MFSLRVATGGANDGGLLDVSNDGIRCSNPADGVRGLGPGTGNEVDFEGGRFVYGFGG